MVNSYYGNSTFGGGDIWDNLRYGAKVSVFVLEPPFPYLYFRGPHLCKKFV